jgi:tRNA C32,U32 (ribose-2'-O)-methylase TrmJ
MVLVEEQAYNDMWRKPPWKRPAVDNSKTHLSTSLESQLDSTDLPDDVKAKLYQKTLKRFLNIKQQVPDLQTTALNGLIDETKPAHKQVRKRKPARWPAVPTRYSHRKHIPWSRLGNE